MTKETYMDALKRISKTNISSEFDDKLINYIAIRFLNLPKCKVISGIVYPMGYGQPCSIHSFAKTSLDIIEDVINKKGA